MNNLSQRLLPALMLLLCGTVQGQESPATQQLESLQTPLPELLNLQLPIESWQTAQGSKVLFVRSSQLPMFDLQVVFDASGARDDGASGLAQLTLGMLDEGTASRDAAQIADGFDEIGARLKKTVRLDNAVVSLRSLSAEQQRDQAVALLVEMLGKPRFAEDNLQRIKGQLASLTIRRHDYAYIKAFDLLFEHAYANHPYAASSYGSAQTIDALTATDLRDFHQRAFTAGNALITLVGDLSPADAREIAQQVSAALPPGPALPALVAPPSFEAEIYHLEHPGTQSLLLAAIPTVGPQHPDAPALALANLILGGPGANSLLFETLRTQRGLTYGAESKQIQLLDGGVWAFTTEVQARYQDGAMQLLEDLLKDYAETGPTEQQFTDAKEQLRGSYLLDSVSNAQISETLRQIGFNQLPLNHRRVFIEQVQALTLDQLKVALKNHLKLDKLVQISVGPTVEQYDLPDPAPAIQ